MPGNQITFGVGFNVNESNLNKLKQSLKEIQQMSAKDLMGTGNFQTFRQAETELKKIKQSATEVQGALNRAFNASLGTTNISKFNAELQKLNLAGIAQQFNSAGAAGRIAFNNLATAAMTSNVKLKQTYSLLENMKTTLTNTIKWNIASSAINSFTGSISNAFNYVKALDASLTDIRIVTGDSREEMARFAVEANNAAQALGRQTKEYTNAALAFYQQGLNDREVQARTEASLKAQNVTGAGTEIVDDLTAVWNGFQVTTENTEKYVDKLAAVADSSASNLSELATAMSKVASTANNMGVDMDQLTAQISTIIATTRQAPETVGNALKTIYARINDIKAGSDEAEISLGNYTKRMASLGVSVLDANGRLRDTGSVMEEIGGRWQSMTREQQIYLAQTMAGQRQMNNLIALFDNWQQYSDMLNVSLNAEGALNEKNARYMESLSAHLNQFKAATEGLQDTIIDEEAIKSVVDAGTGLVNLFNNLLISMGGMKTAGIALGGVLLQTFSSNIASGIVNFIDNIHRATENADLLTAKLRVIQTFSNVENNGLVNKLTDWTKQVTQFQQAGVISGEEAASLNGLMQQYNELKNQQIAWDEAKRKAQEYYNNITEGSGAATEEIITTSETQRTAIENNLKTQETFYSQTQKELQKSLELIKKYQAAKEEYDLNVNTKDAKVFANYSTRAEELVAARDKVYIDLKNLFDTGGKDLGLTLQEEELASLKQSLQEFDEEITDGTPIDQYLNKYITVYQKMVAAAQNAAHQTRDTFSSNMRTMESDVDNSMQNIEASIENALKTAALKQQIQGVINTLGGIAGMAAGIRSIGNAFKIAGDDSLGAGEKFVQISQALAMGIGMLWANFAKLTGGLNGIRTSLLKLVAAEELAKIETQNLSAEEKKKAIADALHEAGTKKLTAAIEENTIALLKNIGAFLTSPWGVALIAITALTASIWLLVKAYNAETEAAKKASKQAAEAKSQYNEVKQAYDNLKSSLEDYQNAQDAIDQLTVGTQEWRDAIAEANQQVLELLSNYPELSKYMTNNNGRLVISKEGRNAALQAAQSRVNFAQNASLSMSNAANQANLNVDATRVARQIGTDRFTLERALNIRQGLIDQGQNISNSQVLIQALNEVGISNQNLVDALINNDARLEELSGKIQANTQSAEIINQQIAHNANAATGNQGYLNSEYQSAIDRVTQARVSERETRALYRRNSQTDRTVHEAYAAQMGYTYAGNGKGIGNFINQEGQQISVDDVVIRKALALNDALNEVSGSLQQYVDALNKTLKQVASEAEKDAIASFAGGQVGDLSNLTDNQIDQFRNKTAEDALFQEAEQLGFNSAEAFLKAMKEAIDNYDEASGVVENKLKDMFDVDPKDLEDFQLSGKKNLLAALKSAYMVSGSEGANAVKEAIFKSDLSSELQEGLLNIFAGITEDTSISDLENLFDSLGISSNQLGISLEELLDIFGAGKDTFESIANRYKNVWEIVEDLQYGDGISSEQADKLREMGINMTDFFTMSRDGTYILKGSAEELRDLVDQINMNQMQKRVEELNNEIARLEGIDFTKISPPSRDPNANQNILEAVTSLGSNVFGEDITTQAQNLLNRDNNLPYNNAEMAQLNAVFQSVKEHSAEIETHLKNSKEEATFLGQAMEDAFHPVDADVDEDEFRRMTAYLEEFGGSVYGLSENLKNDHEAAQMVAEDFLRAKAAAKDVESNIEKWSKAFSDPQKNIGEYVESLGEVKNTYKDLLNLDNGAELSEGFLKSVDNLELMQEVLEGNQDAYDELADKAQEDILNQAIKDNEDGGMIIPATVDTEALQQQLMADINQIENEIQTIEIGTDLSGDDVLMAKLNGIINAAGMTAEQATAELASMGINADVVEGPPPESQTPAAYSWWVPPTYDITSVGMTGSALGGLFPFAAPQIATPGHVETETSSQTSSGPAPFAFHVENAKRGIGSGGNINHKKLGGGGGSKGKGGGGGGKSKAKEPLKPMKAKVDPYHDVNIKIGDVQEGLEKLGKDRDKLIGKDAVDNLTKQINLLEREKELLKEKAGIAKEELQRQGKELANLGAIFNENGDIANYKDLLLNKQKQVNDAIEQANKLEGDEREAYEKYVKDLEQEYKDLESAIKEFDDTKQLLDDLGADYQDLINEQIEKAIEAFDLEINVKLDLKDAEKDFNDFRKKVIDQVQDDDFGGLAQASARNYSQYYNKDSNGNIGGIIPDLRQHASDVQREIQTIVNGGFSQIYGNDLAAAADDLKKYNDELMDALEEAQEVIDETHDHFLDAIDAMDEAFDTQQENLDKVDDLLQHDMDILQLIHGEENFDEMDNLWQQQVAQDTQRLLALQAEQQYWKDRMDDYEEGTDEWKKAMENWQDAFEKTNEAMITSVENLQSKWENSINAIMSQLRNQTFGGNMDAALEDWDKMTWHSNRYLDSIDRANGLLDLQKNYIDMINKTNDPKIQEKLAELEEKQLDALANKEHLREIDLKLAQQQLTVLQAQMALEDAQQAKTKLRLRRDSQGNYTYQYVADEDNIQEKTQEYLKALNEYRTMANDSLHQDLEDLRDYTMEYYDALQDAQMKYGDDQEALLAEQARLYEMYFGDPDGYINALHNDALSSMTDAQEAMFMNLYGLNQNMEDDLFTKFLGPDAEVTAAARELLEAGGTIPTLLDAFVNDSAATAFANISDLTQEALSGEHGLLPEWSSALWNIADLYEEDFVPRVIDSMNQLQMADQAYVDGLAIMQNAANRTTENIALGLAYDTAYTNALDEATQTLLATQSAEVDQAEEVYNSLKKNEEAFQDQTKAAIDAANALFLYWMALNGKTSSGLPYSIEGIQGKVNISPPNITPTQSNSSKPKSDVSTSDDGGQTTSNSSGNSKSNFAAFVAGAAAGAAGTAASGINKTSKKFRYASGGLNNQSGIAWLDGTANEPEIVLNPEDTRNMLNAVNITRAIFDKVQGLNNAALSNLSSGSPLDLVASAGQTVLQDVVINADFPGVADAAQIKQAFNELINLASQRASGNRRTY